MAVTLNSARISISLSWSVQASNSGAPPTPNSGSWTPALSWTNGSGVGQATDYISVINTLAGGASATYDLTASFGDLVGVSAVNMNTLRAFVIWLLSPSQTGPDGATVGTSASYITVGNASTLPALTAAPPNGLLGVATATLNIANGFFLASGGSSAGGYTAGSSYKNLKIANGDGSNTATIALVFVNS